MKKLSNDYIEEIIKYLKNGMSYGEIGKIYNKSANSIRSMLFRNNIKYKDFAEYEKYKIKRCLKCGKEITGYKKFCDNSCAAKYNNRYRIRIVSTKKKKLCINCEINNVKKENYNFCSNKCRIEYNKKEFIKRWKNGEEDGIVGIAGNTSKYIKDYIFEKYDSKCAVCGWNKVNPYTNKIPLQVEHIDGNYANNKEENLILLCPSCHSLTPTYGARNKGNGRPRYNIIKSGYRGVL